MGIHRRIVCFGEALIDMLAQPPATPDAPRAFLQFAGGAPANVSVAVARLGGDSHFVGMLGNDMFGDFLLQSLREAGVTTDGVVRTDKARTALAFVALDARGERSFSFYRPPSADMLFRAAHFDRLRFEDIRLFHVCSVCMTEEQIARTTFEGMRRARAAGALVSFDMNLRPMLWPRDEDPASRLWQALALADMVKLSREEFDWLCDAAHADGAAVIERLWQGNAQLLLVTDGDHPLRWHTREDSGEVPAFRVQMQDSTAAGDAFVGGLLYQLARLPDGTALSTFCRDRAALEQSVRFAAAAGALAVTRKGAFAAMPTRDDVLALIEAQS
ncbi:MAG: carbohydrate kinase [Proteobacteria bacterium]|uniref:carbohydrate kinase n=1 Tax=Rudaea sp. TaxID=2136325 RepID=UPI0037849C4C|nr:carbohydrate kinase [Pseudomonadota bacterium]